MSSCSFASYLSMRVNAVASAASNGSTGGGNGAAVAAAPSSSSSHGFHLPSALPPHAHLPSPLDLSDAGSPHKRQRNTSPDHSAPSSASTLRPEANSYFAFAASNASITTIHAPTPSSSTSSTPCAIRSILCTPSSPSRFATLLAPPSFRSGSTFSLFARSTSPSSPYTSPPCSRPLSRRSSTSKSVRFARCTNASVFPTHSTDEYDRSPIVPTGVSESLELKRTDDDDDDGGWVQCHVRDKKRQQQQDKDAQQQAAIQAAAVAAGAKLPKHASAMENPVEGVHGLIEGGFFVGDSAERDGAHPALAAASSSLSTVAAAAAVDTPPAIPEVEDDEQLEFFEDEGMVVDDSTESASDESHSTTTSSAVPRLVRTGSLSDDDSSSVSAGSSSESALRSSSPDGTGLDPDAAMHAAYGSQPRIRRGSATSSDGGGAGSAEEGAAGEPPEPEEREKKRAECRKRFGLCAFGKVSRSELFASHDSLGGF
ncbi:hypothetical protein JCM6882_001658 [Rhodosporidiobolus microsporus]